MKVVFLDFDGVVLPFDASKAEQRACAERVNRLVQTTGAQVVASTSWRVEAMLEGWDWREAHASPHWRGVVDFMKKGVGLDVPFIGLTPDFFDPNEDDPQMPPGTRGREIQAWLAEHPEVTSWIAIDDVPDWLLPELLPRSVIVRPRVGFDDASLEQALQLLQG